MKKKTTAAAIDKTPDWKALQAKSASFKPDLAKMFARDQKRASRFSVSTRHLHFDYSRQLVDDKVMKILLSLADASGMREKIKSMFAGEKMNVTEGRAVLHVALRNLGGEPILVDGKNVMPDVLSVLNRIRVFAESVHSGERLGVTGKKFRNIISIGIGGSYLGPEYLATALVPHSRPDTRLIFIANIDGTDFFEKVRGLDPEETMVIVVSKTFTTAETMHNARTAKKWILEGLKNHPETVKKHFAAVSTAKDKVSAFGIDPDNMFGFWDWVGGRFSATSAVGALPLSLYLGFKNFKKILEGARWMDEHFLNEPFEKNVPVLCALLDIWNINFLGHRVRALLPYSQGLGKLPAHTQQVEMESNGKSVDISGKPLKFDTGEVVFGEPGTNGQHSFYQLIHQGTQVIPCDFIGFLKPQYFSDYDPETTVTHHEELMTNFFAQPDALAFGKKETDLTRNFSGNRPSSSLLLEMLTPFTAGLLLAWTEHRAAAKGFIWGINSFDQFGVELGKKLGVKVRQDIVNHHRDPGYRSDSGLIDAFLDQKLPS
ncbi:MAG TPA: glucose-6-phosphate isomerase [Candidatus Omnitrophota bacterium]|nr:glucose-6-phosphate isomerase [Candidatus Omnitrophota bacterium]